MPLKEIVSIAYFKFYLGGYDTLKHEVVYTKGMVLYSTSELYDNSLKSTKVISLATVQLFITRSNQLKVIDWKKRYRSGVCDGEEWELEVKYNNKAIKKIYGHMQYPGNLANDHSRSPIFNDLLLSINTFIEQPNFFPTGE